MMRKLIFEKEALWVPGNSSVGIVTVSGVIQKAYLTLEQAGRRGMGAGRETRRVSRGPWRSRLSQAGLRAGLDLRPWKQR